MANTILLFLIFASLVGCIIMAEYEYRQVISSYDYLNELKRTRQELQTIRYSIHELQVSIENITNK